MGKTNSKTLKSRINYREYIVSETWRKKHPGWLKQANYRCSMFPWIKVGKGKPYNCHHTNYKSLGKEVYSIDILIVSPLAHKWVIHGLLSNFKRPSQQERYPNLLQTLAHSWCRLPSVLKLLLGLGLFITLLKQITWLIS